MRQEVRFLLAITLMILVLVTTNILFPPVPPEELSGPEVAPVGAPVGAPTGQLDISEVTGTPTIPLGGADAGGAAAGGAAAVFRSMHQRPSSTPYATWCEISRH